MGSGEERGSGVWTGSATGVGARARYRVETQARAMVRVRLRLRAATPTYLAVQQAGALQQVPHRQPRARQQQLVRRRRRARATDHVQQEILRQHLPIDAWCHSTGLVFGCLLQNQNPAGVPSSCCHPSKKGRLSSSLEHKHSGKGSSALKWDTVGPNGDIVSLMTCGGE